MKNQQGAPEALRLANEFKLCNEYDSIPSITDIAKAEAELRRLHAENTTLQQGYDAARLEIESLHARIAELEAQLEAIGAGGVSGPLMGRASLAASAGSEAAAPAGAAQKYDDTLVPFLALMRRELHANSSKGDRPGWLSMRPDQCLLEIYWHAAKLSAAVKNGDQALIAEHAADVANMAMMQADIAGLLSLPTAQPAPVAQGDALTYEQSYAIRQGHEIASSDAYFEARPQIDNNDRRGVFRAGFDRGWDAARAQAQEGASHG